MQTRSSFCNEHSVSLCRARKGREGGDTRTAIHSSFSNSAFEGDLIAQVSKAS